MIRLIAATAFTLVIVTSTHAITLAPLHQSDGMVTQVGHACGSGMHMANGHCVKRRCLVWGAGHGRWRQCRRWAE